jgi:hypothetical protein
MCALKGTSRSGWKATKSNRPTGEQAAIRAKGTWLLGQSQRHQQVTPPSGSTSRRSRTPPPSGSCVSGTGVSDGVHDGVQPTSARRLAPHLCKSCVIRGAKIETTISGIRIPSLATTLTLQQQPYSLATTAPGRDRLVTRELRCRPQQRKTSDLLCETNRPPCESCFDPSRKPGESAKFLSRSFLATLRRVRLSKRNPRLRVCDGNYGDFLQ